ncbi:MAG: hypothetical protein U9R02_14280 [Thermodesulfobacteriota bacterium]|nr:hypothetical protein [Thermodesulfobacteriota bacterium]
MKNNLPVGGKKLQILFACDVAPPSKRDDYFCLSSGKAKNILIILYILSKKSKRLPLRLR